MTDLRSPEEVAKEVAQAFRRFDGTAAAIIRADREQVERDTIRRVVEWLDAQANGRLQSPVYLARCIEAGEWKQ